VPETNDNHKDFDWDYAAPRNPRHPQQKSAPPEKIPLIPDVL